MSRLIWPLIASLGFALVGCNPAEHTISNEEPVKPAASAPTPAPKGAPAVNQANTQGGNGGDVQIYGMGAGAATPVTGGENLGGGGGGVQSAAKDQAKRVAGKSGGSSLDQLPADN